jgi:hypothetical protein
MASGINEEGIGFETRPSGECDLPEEEKSNLLIWIIGIGVIVALIA